jgi:L-malate glycosyltransferase
VGLILESLARALPDSSSLRLLVVGRGTRAAEVLEAPVKQLGLEHAVVRAGYLKGDEYLDVLAQMDALVYLVPGSDGSCRAALEASAMGIPAIASRRGALPELLGDSALLCDESVDALSAALRSFRPESPEWRARSEAAHQRALSQFAIARYAERCEALYTRLRSA